MCGILKKYKNIVLIGLLIVFLFNLLFLSFTQDSGTSQQVISKNRLTERHVETSHHS